MPPRFNADEVAAVAADLFGLVGEAQDLGSERDQTFLIAGSEGDGVVKISNLGENPASLELEAAAIAHVARVDPGLPVARLLASDTFDGPERDPLRAFVSTAGRPSRRSGLPDNAVRDYGATHARLTLALRGFFHPAAGRELLWDLAHAARSASSRSGHKGRPSSSPGRIGTRPIRGAGRASLAAAARTGRPR